MNDKKVHLVYKELGLQLRNNKLKRRVKAKLREERWLGKSEQGR